jgi:4,5-DOPA dioxygenase extradiol
MLESWLKGQLMQKKGAQMVYFSHGGGPLPILGDPGHRAMIDFMAQLHSRLRKPEAILVISAHWEESVATLMGSSKPPMLYDYYGFPREAYRITYPAPGDPSLADRIRKCLEKENIPTGTDAERGFDHGLFIPLTLMYPRAEIPSIQISLLSDLESSTHIALGRALRGMMDENLLVIGSGFSFHNLRAFRFDGKEEPDPRNDAFQDWLIETCTGSISQDERERRLMEWETAPNARYCHPREDHLLPLHVCAGLAQAPGAAVFDNYIAGKRAVAFLWQ